MNVLEKPKQSDESLYVDNVLNDLIEILNF